MKSNKLSQLINYRLGVILTDGRSLTGQMLAYDKHLNLVLADCEEQRQSKNQKKGAKPQEFKRNLGLVIIRGETIISMSVEAGPPPSADNKSRIPASVQVGAGVGRPMGRGIPNVRGGLAINAQPVSYAPQRPMPPGYRPPQ